MEHITLRVEPTNPHDEYAGLSLLGNSEAAFPKSPQQAMSGHKVHDNFHLEADSPAIDAGVDIGIRADFDGVPRPQGPRPDLGAYGVIQRL